MWCSKLEQWTIWFLHVRKTELAELKFLVHFTYNALGFCMHHTTFFNHQNEHTQYTVSKFKKKSIFESVTAGL